MSCHILWMSIYVYVHSKYTCMCSYLCVNTCEGQRSTVDVIMKNITHFESVSHWPGAQSWTGSPVRPRALFSISPDFLFFQYIFIPWESAQLLYETFIICIFPLSFLNFVAILFGCEICTYMICKKNCVCVCMHMSMHTCARKLTLACTGRCRHTDATAFVWGSEGTLPVSILAFQLLWDSLSSLLHNQVSWPEILKILHFLPSFSLQVHAEIIDTYVQTLKIFNFWLLHFLHV